MEILRAHSIVFGEQDGFPLRVGTLHHEVVTMKEQPNIPFHVDRQHGIAKTLDETVLFQDLRVMRLPTSTGVHCATRALSQQANVFQIGSVLACEPLFLLESSTNTRRTGTPWECARLRSYIARVRLHFASS